MQHRRTESAEACKQIGDPLLGVGLITPLASKDPLVESTLSVDHEQPGAAVHHGASSWRDLTSTSRH